ncbi:MAG: type II toxin-antitoxin system VapC family toxin [Armatimonadetes bacterium]|nr:type II toxin-antitoxin system VapC family toxin [Armatimonadota bacterium]
MPQLVLDASIALAWCFGDEGGDLSDRALDMLAVARAAVPLVFMLEVGNSLLVGERRGRLTTTQTAAFVEMLHGLPVDVDGAPPNRVCPSVLDLGRQYRLAYYDACYLELALRLGLPLATDDRALLRAMSTAGVAAF